MSTRVSRGRRCARRQPSPGTSTTRRRRPEAIGAAHDDPPAAQSALPQTGGSLRLSLAFRALAPKVVEPFDEFSRSWEIFETTGVCHVMNLTPTVGNYNC